MDVNNILDIVADTATSAFRNSYAQRGYSTTGSVYESIQRKGHNVVASIPVATMIYGRKPGRFPPWGYSFGSRDKSSLMKWAMNKFNLDSKDAKTVSFLIARKLKMYGNDVYRKLKPPIDTEAAQQAAVVRMRELILLNHRQQLEKK